MLASINSQLSLAGHSSVSKRTLYTQLKDWGLNSRHEAVKISEDLINRVKYYFFNFGFSNTSILRDLQKEGFQANHYIIRQIRYRYGMKRRARTAEEQDERLNKAIQFLQDDLRRSSAILGFGKGLLYQYVR
ncbi:hypothetical protein VFPPC_17473 [Pochonia chlamydosporia 170]|uniref:Clr5 domain-containing protein n=1 Tax=Pochonia chlamydosporia 170 TaxID=1380566 RepID=A0A219AST1_METCM|nr:hypothetical protein VFPPC_17473 [Pochonia chlamydosporia 170]OWT43364.1 hypothetical protein VFPPC_17473 [Pochonia chlamydosporia 170]